MNTWERKGAVCPFYKKESAYKIICEGVEDNSSLSSSFGTPAKKSEYACKYCDKDWEHCIIAKALNGKYD